MSVFPVLDLRGDTRDIDLYDMHMYIHNYTYIMMSIWFLFLFMCLFMLSDPTGSSILTREQAVRWISKSNGFSNIS